MNDSLLKVYVYGKCSTCKNALRFLDQHRLKADVVEITQQPPSLAELRAMLAFHQGQVRKLFNSSGQLYREMQLSEKLNHLSEKEALSLLHHHGMLVKRPFLLAKEHGLIGFHEKEWERLLG